MKLPLGVLISKLFEPQNWGVGNILVSRTTAEGNVMKPAAMVNEISVVETDEQLNDMRTVSFQTVFNNWKRIAMGGSNPNVAPAELNAWAYDAASDAVKCTVNSVSTVGFISPDKYDNYTFEVEMSSTDTDDDTIGLCAAYVEENGVAHAIFVAFAGSLPFFLPKPQFPFQAIYNPQGNNVTDPNSKVLGKVVGNLTYCNGTAIPATGSVNDSNGQGGFSTSGPFRIKIVREGTKFTCYCSRFNSTVYDVANSFSFDIANDASMARFKAPCSIGFIANSQNSTTYKSIQQPGLKEPILDIRTKTVWTWNGSAWASSPLSAANFPLIPGVMYSSRGNDTLYFVKANGDLKALANLS